MTSKFKVLSLSQKERMRNGTHLNYMSLIDGFISKYSTENEGFLARQKAFKEALAYEDKCFVLCRSSEHTDKLRAAEDARDSLYKSIYHLILSYAEISTLPQYEAAIKLKRLVKSYGYSTRWKRRQKTGAIASLVGDMQSEAFQTEVESLGLTSLVTQLKEQNDVINPSLEERSHQMSKINRQALQKARVATDVAYDELAQYVESMCCFMQDKKLSEIIDSINYDVKDLIQNELTNRKHAKDEAPADQSQGGTGDANQQGGATDVRPEGDAQGQGNSSGSQTGKPGGTNTGGTSGNTTGAGQNGSASGQTGGTPTNPKPSPEGQGGTNGGGSQPTDEEKPGGGTGGIVTEAKPEKATV